MASVIRSNKATISQKAFIVFTVLATGALASGYVSKHMWPWVTIIVIYGSLWLFGQKRGWRWVASSGLIIFACMAGHGVFLDIPPRLLLLCIVLTLFAWDLDYFIRRLNRVDRVEKARNLEWQHLKRLMIIAGVGLFLGELAIGVRFNLNFGWMLFSGIVLILGLSRLFGLLHRDGEASPAARLGQARSRRGQSRYE